MTDLIETNRKIFPKEYENWVVADKVIDPQKVFEPKSDYNAQYGKIRVYSYRAGHSIEVDETPGYERFRIIHPNGSYVEMQSSGKTIYRSNNHNYQVAYGDNNIRVKGTCHIHVDGDANIKVDGSATYEVGGDLTEKIGGSWTVKVGKDITLQAGGTINLNK